MPWENTGSGTSCSGTARPATGARTGVVLTFDSFVSFVPRVHPRIGSCARLPERRSHLHCPVDRLPLSFGGWRYPRQRRSEEMSDTTKPEGKQAKSGVRIPG